jgi:hypothetical protein
MPPVFVIRKHTASQELTVNRSIIRSDNRAASHSARFDGDETAFEDSRSTIDVLSRYGAQTNLQLITTGAI